MAATTLEFVLYILRCVGLCPLTTTSKGQYEFRWNSAGVIWNTIIALAACFFHFVYVTHVIFKQCFIFGPGIRQTQAELEAMIKKNTAGQSSDQFQASMSVLNVITLLGCLQFLVNVGASWANRHVLPQLLNHQAQLELSLDRAGAPMYQQKPNSKSVEKFKQIQTLAVAFSLSLTPILVFASGQKSHADYLLELFVTSFVLGSIGFSGVLLEYVVILSFEQLRQQFEQVRISIQNWRERSCKPAWNDCLDDWCDTLLQIRQQGALLSQYLAPSLLPSLLQTMVLCTLCLFYSLTVMQGRAGYAEDSQKVGVVCGYIGCTFAILLRLYFEVNLAQRITNEEGEVVEELTKLGLKEQPGQALKINQLRDFMLKKPCEIVLADMVVMRRRLALGIMSQIATYLIVMTQFFNS